MKKISVQDFITANPKPQGQSKLTPFKDDILFLKNQGYTTKQILLFLSQNDIVISPNALNVFIRKNINVPNHQTETHKPLQPKETIGHQTKKEQKTKSGIKKFDWKNATTDGLI